MFKFLKSKKGFTLVELMIVVVIMAILVAVAVPIYSAVTANAKKKTCIGNMREIVSSVTNSVMLAGGACSGDFTITTVDAGDNGTFADEDNNLTGITLDQVKALFKTVPYCPVAGAEITVTISSAADGSNASVSPVCDKASEGHVLPTNTTT